VFIAVLEGCSATTSEVDTRRTAFWAAATECARGNPALKVEDIDADGRIRLTVLQGGQQAVSAFTACYNQKANENMAAAARVGSPPRIVESEVGDRTVRCPHIGTCHVGTDGDQEQPVSRTRNLE
jgi:hypothetical protein